MMAFSLCLNSWNGHLSPPRCLALHRYTYVNLFFLPAMSCIAKNGALSATPLKLDNRVYVVYYRGWLYISL